jgi:hypothetical protein
MIEFGAKLATKWTRFRQRGAAAEPKKELLRGANTAAAPAED